MYVIVTYYRTKIVWLFAQNHNGQLKFSDNSNENSSPIYRITNDARECEMEENMGQVNTMIGNVFRTDAANRYAKLKFLFVFFFGLFVSSTNLIWIETAMTSAILCLCDKKEALDFVSFLFALYSMFIFPICVFVTFVDESVFVIV